MAENVACATISGYTIMAGFMRNISIIARCATQFRSDKLGAYGLNGCQTPYILGVCREPGITQDELARRICVNKSSVTRQAAALEEAGFVRREPSETDRRAVLVYPEDKAIEVLPRIREIHKEWRDYLTEELTAQERELVEVIVEKLALRAARYQNERGGEQRQ